FLLCSINKAINTQEVAVKEKHARNILTLCKGAHTFWAAVNRLPLSSNAVLCWKFCHVFHKLLRDGHPNVRKHENFGHLSEGYGKLCSIYLKLLITKMEFHIKVNMSRSVSVTAAGQCRLAPLIQVILDCSHLYDYTVKLLFKLHSCLPADTLQGHRDRFQEQFKKLKSLFYRSSNLQYFKRLIQIPQLPENPPNFLRASALSEHISPVVVIPAESSSPESEHVVETDDLVDTDVPVLRFTCCVCVSLYVFTRLLPGKAQANEQRYTKLKEKYTELVQSHADLLRKAAQESEKAELVQSLSKVEAELAARGEELERVQSSLVTERESRVKSAETLQNQLNEKVMNSNISPCKLLNFSHFKSSTWETRAALSVQIAMFVSLTVCVCPQESREQALESQLAAARWASLQGAVEEAEKIIQDSLAQIDDPAHISCTSSADYLASRCQASLECMERLNSTRVAFLADNTGVSELVRAVTQSGHLVGDTIVQGSATSHMVPVEQADALSESVKVCGAEALALLGLMKQQDGLAAADSGKLKAALEAVLATAEKLRPQGLELQQGELGDLVEQEMAATSAAVESAAARIEEMLNNSRAVDTGIKMEVNERILASCTELMQAIKELILSSKDLQRDIVESGRGAASMKEFYAKNSRWTEGLISASKAVGWGATVMVDAADLVVQGKGKFEELMVCSHEIAASTAQLVAASKVKADKDSTKLHRLQQASRGVTQATAAVVASTKSGKSQIEETDTMDFSSMTLTQIKRQEMDAQVLVLELETRLQKERERLGELRKKHYELAGVAEGWGEDEEGGHLRYNLCTVLKKP
uniref:I/LWEQ domain-containing protein n=1 Tax=Astatotilapia calliptera TaxID=8154 RepID=A0AAX7U7Z3_ASTCA